MLHDFLKTIAEAAQAEVVRKPKSGPQRHTRRVGIDLPRMYGDHRRDPISVHGVEGPPDPCGGGDGVSHHLIYLVGLGDPDSTIPGDRFLGTYELVLRNGEWVVGASNLALFTDWQLELDDPLSQIACGDVQPWGS